MREYLKLRVDTFFWHRQLPRLCYLDGLGGLISSAFRHIFHLLHDVVAFQYFSKDYMLSIQPSNAALVRARTGVYNN